MHVPVTSEPKRWIMSYGRDAEALWPGELRARVKREVEELRGGMDDCGGVAPHSCGFQPSTRGREASAGRLRQGCNKIVEVALVDGFEYCVRIATAGLAHSKVTQTFRFASTSKENLFITGKYAMLREIINFTRSLSPESFKRGLQPAQGFHIVVGINEAEKLHIKEHEFFKKDGEVTRFLNDCLEKQIYTSCVSERKRLDAPKKMNRSSSPFCIAFAVDDFTEKLLKENLQSYFQKLYENTLEYCQSEIQKEYAKIFLCSCNKEFLLKITQLPNYQNLKKADFIYVYFDKPELTDYKLTHESYLAKRAVNKKVFNAEINGRSFGVPDYLTTYGEKKLFLQHHTAAFTLNTRIDSDDIFEVFKFAQLVKNKQLPNPLPIFVEKEELNEETVKIFHKNEMKRLGYAEMIRAVYEKDKDLGNYYLLNMQGKDIVKDFDFVSSFQFKIEPPIYIENLFSVESDLTSQKTDDIFEFEKMIVGRIFDWQLVKKKNEGWWLRYFEDIEYKPQYIRATMYQLVLKYRKAFYDYIYKSRREAVTSRIFYDIMLTGILDDLRQDAYNDKIKEKLNIWFSLFEYFDQNRKSNGDQTMANQIRQLQERMQKVVSDEAAHLETDQEFAYAAGLVIYYLLSCSETGNKTHALLEPFLQKTDAIQFKLAISRSFAQYKHAIYFSQRRFNKMMAEVLSFEPEAGLKSLLPMILAGYFAENVIYPPKHENAKPQAS